MINKLTKEQERAMDEYVVKWKAIGLSTERCNRPQAEKAIDEAYRLSELKIPSRKVWVESPLAALIVAALDDAFPGDDPKKFVKASADIVKMYMKNGEPKRSNKYIKKAKEQDFKQALSEYNSGFIYGNQDAGWLAFYSFFKNEMKIQLTEKLDPLFELAYSAGWILPFDDLVIFSERPTGLHMEGDQLHKDMAPAVSYADGFSIYSLHGVRVPKEIVMTAWDKMDVNLITKTTNAEIRRELVRKIGIERVCDKLNAQCVDKGTFAGNDYELLLLDIGDGRKRPYLKMKNPSIGVFHIEGVAPECKTVMDAIKFRNGSTITPEVVT